MIRPSTVLAGWAALLVVLGLVLLGFSPPQYAWVLLAGAGLALAPLGALMLVPGARAGEPRSLPETSLPTVVVAAGLAVLVLGLVAGPWLVALGGELLALGLFVLGRELLAQRRARRR